MPTPVAPTVGPGLRPQRHIHRRNIVTDMRYDGTEEGAAALCRWVLSLGGEATVDLDGLLVKTQVKWIRVPAGYWVGHGVVGQFWVISNEVHVGSYDPLGPDYNAIVDRDTAAAMVVEADRLEDWARRDDDFDATAHGAIYTLREYIHQLATTAEALR